jgi:aryl-alcohol dehydrogenase-like predicted oxidoreductase
VQATLDRVQRKGIELNETLNIGGDLVVRRLGYGAMRLTGRGIWGDPHDPAGARAVLSRAVQLGVTFIDTADSYGPRVSERLIAEALRPYRAGLLIATKGGYERPGPGVWQPNGRPEQLRDACEGSLRRLGIDQIDLYQLHTVDPRVPLEESVGALAELRRQGKIRHVGLSNVSVEQIERARRVVQVASVQNRYNIADRAADDVVRYCQEEGIPFICWRPVESGLLASGALRDVALAHQATSIQIALSWLLHRSPVTVAIPGTSSLEHLEENMGALGIRLTSAELSALDEFRLGRPQRLGRRARRTARLAVVGMRRLRRSPSG